MATYLDAQVFAHHCHAGQVDRGGAPYIDHVLRVGRSFPPDSSERTVGFLHDVLEDNMDLTRDDLRAAGYTEEIVDAVVSVTRNSDEGYSEFILRVLTNPIGRRVKIADILDNMDLTRIQNPTKVDFMRVEKYRKALRVLLLLLT